MLDFLFDGIAGLLSFFFDVSGSIGVSIVLLTIALMVLTFPLTLKSTRSMMEMQRLQPEMKKIQDRNKGDREKLNQELMAFYQEHQINPLSGCLPLILQMPIFIVLFQVLRGLGSVTDGMSTPKYLDQGSALYENIVAGGGSLHSFGFDLADAATSSHGDFASALPYYVLIALVAATAFAQQRQAMGRRDPNQPVNPQQQMMQRVMVIFLPLISLSIPAGVVIYFFVSNVFRIGQQALIHRTAPASVGNRPSTASSSSGPEGSKVIEATEAPTDEDSAPAKKPHPRSKKKKKRKR